MTQSNRLFFAVYFLLGSLANAAMWFSHCDAYTGLHGFFAGLFILLSANEVEIYLILRRR